MTPSERERLLALAARWDEAAERRRKEPEIWPHALAAAGNECARMLRTELARIEGPEATPPASEPAPNVRRLCTCHSEAMSILDCPVHGETKP